MNVSDIEVLKKEVSEMKNNNALPPRNLDKAMIGILIIIFGLYVYLTGNNLGVLFILIGFVVCAMVMLRILR